MQVLLDNITKAFGERTLLKEVNHEFHKGTKTALIGRNGCGKSTLFGIITGAVEPDIGKVNFGKAVISLMEQEYKGDTEKTVFQICSEVLTNIHQNQKKINELNENYSDLSDIERKKYASLIEKHEKSGGYDWEWKVKNVLFGIGFRDYQLDKRYKKLSGGQRRRCLLARTLLKEPDILLLDEPTNHLDLESILWLENWLKNWKGTLIFISHDRHFLDNVSDEIVELDNMKLVSYPGSYQKFRELRKAYKKQQKKKYELNQDLIKKNEEFIRKNLAGQKTKQAKSRRKMLEKIDRLEPPSHDKNYKLKFKKNQNEGKVVFELENLIKSYKNVKVLDEVSCTVYRGEKIGIIGNNGSGKSTLIKLITGEEIKDAGRIKKSDKNILGYFPQEGGNYNPEFKVIDELWKIIPDSSEEEVRNILGGFLFSNEEADKKIKLLSGGEKSRLLLAQIMLKNPNVIIMDEPTNHLDLQSRLLLERTIADYDGTVFIVSHDRVFLDEIVDSILHIENGKIKKYYGNINSNKDKIFKKIEKEEKNKQNKRKNIVNPQTVNKQISRGANKFKVQKIESIIETMENDIKLIEQEMLTEEVIKDGRKYLELNKKYKEIKKELERRYQEWENIYN